MEVRLATSSDCEGMGDCDAAMRLGDGQWPEHVAVPLVADGLVPVCSPTFVQRSRPSDATWVDFVYAKGTRKRRQVMGSVAVLMQPSSLDLRSRAVGSVD